MSLYLSRLTERLQAPSTDVWQVHDEAVARRQAGEDVILLSVGDPDFATPDYIAQHTVDCIRRGRTHYSPAAGEPELLEAIAELETRITGRPFVPEQFVVFPGATAALFAVFSCIADPGDEILLPEPMYAGYGGVFDGVGVAVRHVALAPPDFELDVDGLIAAIGPRTRAVLVNTPGNPCGNLIPSQALSRLAQACRERDVWLVCDEVYSLITFDEPHVSLLRSTDDLSNIVVIDGLSKSHAMSGWRIGWAVAPPALAAELVRFSGATFFGVCQFAQDGAACALRRDAPDVEKMRLEYQRRRDYALRRLDAIPELDCFRPRGGMFVMVDVSRVATDGEAFARRLLDEALVSTLPGRGFGPGTANYVRLGLTHPVSTLEAVFDRIEAMLHR